MCLTSNLFDLTKSVGTLSWDSLFLVSGPTGFIQTLESVDAEDSGLVGLGVELRFGSLSTFDDRVWTKTLDLLVLFGDGLGDPPVSLTQDLLVLI